MFYVIVVLSRSGLQFWHDTNGEEDAIIPLWKDENLVLDYKTFWGRKDIWKPYVTKAVSEEAIRNYETSLQACTPRIRIMAEDRADNIIENIQVVLHKSA